MLMSLLLASIAQANERKFVYTYETFALPPDARELEIWTTIRPEEGGPELIQRAELEMAIGPRLLTALYLNWEAGPAGATYEGVSNEWKWTLTSRVAQPVGVALYGEWALGPHETELEAKLLLDKELGKALVAANFVGEYAIERPGGEVQPETEIEEKNILAFGYTVAPGISLGAEAVNTLEFHEGELEYVKLQAGPNAQFTTQTFWVAGTAMIGVLETNAEEPPPFEVRTILGLWF